ncbi:MAG: 50S ribosomal protein L18 [Bdellovibrionales bacterium]|nr:50S ribosomal protein L18 [Bdellovibrionales bacterium]
MRVTIKKKWDDKKKLRTKKRLRIRKKIAGDQERPRLCVYKSAKNIFAQMIDDSTGQTLVSASTLQDKIEKTGKDAAFEVGKLIAEKAKQKNITKAVFDRSGYYYHGRIKSLADGAREAGLQV